MGQTLHRFLRSHFLAFMARFCRTARQRAPILGKKFLPSSSKLCVRFFKLKCLASGIPAARDGQIIPHRARFVK